MDQLRAILSKIQKQLGTLSTTQKLLIGSLTVVVLMTLFLISQYAGSPTMVALIPTGTPEDQQKAAGVLEQAGVATTTRSDGVVLVPVESKYAAIAALSRSKAMPQDTELMFRNLAQQQNWLQPRSVQDQMFITALCNELSRVIEQFPGIEKANVMISRPEPRGIGAAAVKPVAQVTVFPTSGELSQRTVDALGDMVSGSISGLDIRNVSIIDGRNKRRHRATAADDALASSYTDQVSQVEQRVQQKIEEHLGRFIADVVVSVHAMIDASAKSTRTEKILPKGEGTVSLPRQESTTSMSSTSASRGSEPGLAPNTGLDLNSGPASGGGNTSDETGDNTYENQFGRTVENKQDPRGKPTKINVTVSVPRGYMEQVIRLIAPETPADAPVPQAEIEKQWPAEMAKLEKLIRPLVDTKDVPGALAEAGDVVVSLIPVALAAAGGGGAGGAGGVGGGGGGGGLMGFGGTLAGGGGGLIKQVVLGGLAAVAVGMMLMLVRKAAKPVALPSAEELVGIPPAIQPGSDVVGEADEGETAMPGIEIDSNALKTNRMLEEITELVKSNPSSAATVFNRWLAPEP